MAKKKKKEVDFMGHVSVDHIQMLKKMMEVWDEKGNDDSEVIAEQSDLIYDNFLFTINSIKTYLKYREDEKKD